MVVISKPQQRSAGDRCKCLTGDDTTFFVHKWEIKEAIWLQSLLNRRASLGETSKTSASRCAIHKKVTGILLHALITTVTVLFPHTMFTAECVFRFSPIFFVFFIRTKPHKLLYPHYIFLHYLIFFYCCCCFVFLFNWVSSIFNSTKGWTS